ncbi:transposase [Yersinia similis]|uniref:Transposase n=1 Tax=Yersinia similis TaxID=367190 RepID=A0ABM5PVR8_9GAMM|nr:transposase [Yersinia similis]
MSSNRYSPELREQAVRLVLDHRSEYSTELDAVRAVAPKIGCHADTLRAWMRQHEQNTLSPTTALTTNEHQRLKELERENRELRRSNDILRQASAYFAQAELDRHWKK